MDYKLRDGTKVRVVRLLDPFTNKKYLGKVGRIMKVNKGYYVLLEGMGEHEEEHTFMEGELEAVG